MQSYPKGNRGESHRASEPKKRRYQGNQFQTKEGKSTYNAEGDRISRFKNLEDMPINGGVSYKIVNLTSVFSAISEIVVCGTCKSKVTFEESSRQGLAFNIVVKCRCPEREGIPSSPKIRGSSTYDINVRTVFAMRLLSVNFEGLNLFCNLMDFGKDIGKTMYKNTTTKINETSEFVFNFCCEKAVTEEIALNQQAGEETPTDLKASGDGTWKKKGHTSLFGIVTLIAQGVGKVVDLDVLSNFCLGCAKNDKKNPDPDSDAHILWQYEHQLTGECTRNHEGSSGSMEPKGMMKLFQRSVKKHGVRYAVYIGDGDSSTYKNILDSEPYNNFTVEKRECVGHVQKRMGTRLRKVKKDQKLGGHGKLTDNLIKELTLYYGLAIRRNKDSTADMKNEILATYYHKISTDEEPRHEFCSIKWCWWLAREQARKDADDPEFEAELEHDPPLHPDVAAAILPIYQDLSRDDLLDRCLGGYTQNSNESLNALIWKFAPKHLHSGKEIVEIAAYIGASIYNEGYSAILWMMADLGILIGEKCHAYATSVNERREKKKKARLAQATHKARKARIEELTDAESDVEQLEDVFYAPGAAD